ncbi:hypothetical protein RINTHM_10520 [Richelia intracellularis HM01]|nr:hypothetical protein RINTHM_10520 [Richelia intracellularis HM01]
MVELDKYYFCAELSLLGLSGYGESINHSNNITIITDSYIVKVQ